MKRPKAGSRLWRSILAGALGLGLGACTDGEMFWWNVHQMHTARANVEHGLDTEPVFCAFPSSDRQWYSLKIMASRDLWQTNCWDPGADFVAVVGPFPNPEPRT